MKLNFEVELSQHINERIQQVIAEEAEKAAEAVQRRVREDIARYAVNMAKWYQVETMQDQVVIKVTVEDRK